MTIHHRRTRVAALAVASTLVFATLGLASAGSSPTWVFLRDKDVTSGESLRSAILQSTLNLTPEARARRAARGVGASADELALYDLPVASSYVDQIGGLAGSVRVKSAWLNAVSVDATPAQLAQIAALPFVDHVQPVIGVMQPLMTNDIRGESAGQPPEATNDFYGASSSQLTQINVPAVHALGYTGTGMRIGILDSGFKRTHAAFNQAGHVLNVIAEHDFINGDTSTAETTNNQHQHGTWVLGTIGAYQPNVLVGGAYNASFILAKTEIVPTETQVEEDYWVAGLEYLESNGADIVTSSLGYIDWYTQAQLNGHTAVTTVAALAAAQRGLVITNAAGNEGHDTNPLTSHLIAPADADLLITVGAVDAAGIAGSFSSDGPTADGRVKPELMARGVAAATVLSNSDSGTTTLDGTSFATPLVASAVTLVLQAHPDWTIEQLRFALFNTASRNGVFDPQYVAGYGIMNTLAAVQYSFDKYYTNSSSGAFALGSNWTRTGAPLAVDNVFITPSTSLTVSGPTTTTRIHRLTLGATSGQLATLALNGNSSFTIDEKLALNATGRLALSNGSLTVRGTTTNNGTIDLAAPAQFADVVGIGTFNANVGATVSVKSVRQNSLSVAGRLTLAQSISPTVSNVKSLAITGGAAPTGTLDIGTNVMVIDYAGTSPLPTIAAQIAFAAHNGAWDRAGITTSQADARHGVGYAEAAALGTVPALFGTVDTDAILIDYTLLGDADLSGAVEFADLLALAQHYGSIGSAYWFEGDFTYDGSVEFGDLLTLAQNYGLASLSAGQQQSLFTAGGTGFANDWTLARSLVPEPIALTLVGIPMFVFGRRRQA